MPPDEPLTPAAAAALNERFDALDPVAAPAHILTWAAERFLPRLAMTSSFQTQSVALLHLLSRTSPAIPVLFLDTGYHFSETLTYRDQLVAQFGLTLRVVRAEPDPARPAALYRQDPDLCCYVHKVEPMQRALQGLDAWISGIRRDQTAQRAGAQPVELLPDGRVKIHPLLNWTHQDLWTYINRHDLPAHPLFSKGYLSVGCAPCTSPVTADGDERSGRWAGQAKTECGLHTGALTGRRNPSGDDSPQT